VRNKNYKWKAAVTELTPQLQVHIPNTKFHRNLFNSFVRRPCRRTRRCSQFSLHVCISWDFFQLRKNYMLCYLKRLGKLWTLPTKGLSIDPLSINSTVRQLVQSGRAQHEVRNVVCREPTPTQLTEFVFTNARVPPPPRTRKFHFPFHSHLLKFVDTNFRHKHAAGGYRTFDTKLHKT
jgi:hypothetical protein